MAREANGKFYRGETWLFVGQCLDHAGGVLSLEGGNKVQLRIATATELVLDWETPADGEVTSAEEGRYRFEVERDEQGDFLLDKYSYEVLYVAQDGFESVQNVGFIELLPSKFNNFPPA